MPALAAPSNKSGFGDSELAPNAGEAKACSAEAEEFVLCRDIVHKSKVGLGSKV